MTSSKQNNIFVCIACNYPTLPSNFVVALLSMFDNFYGWCKENGRNDTISFLIHGGYQLDEMRNDVTQTALDSGATHLIYFDTDVVAPPKTLIWMLEDLEDNEDQGVGAITGVYHWKTAPFHPYLYSTWSEEETAFNGILTYPIDKLFQVAAAGAGCFMVKREVIENKSPWFRWVKPNQIEELPKGIGEDLYFFWKIKPLMLCDSRISCLHYKDSGIGLKTYLSVNGLEIKDNWITGSKEKSEELIKKANIKAQKGIEEWIKKGK
jgi:hypothetical protein